MIIPSLPGWTPGEKVTAAKLTTHTKTAIEKSVYYKPMCQITNNAQQSIPNTATTAIALPNIVFDTDGMADTTNSRVVIKTAGIYHVRIGGAYAFSPNGFRWVEASGGVVTLSALTDANSITAGHVYAAKMYRLNIGDTIGLSSLQNSGGTLSTNARAMFIEVEWVAM